MIIRPSPLVAALRNEFGGLVHYPVAGRQIARGFRKPDNPQSTSQAASRDALAGASAAWDALTLIERSSWEGFAAGATSQDGFGQTIALSPRDLFIRTNVYRLLDGQSIKGVAPVGNPPNPYSAVTRVNFGGGLVILNVGAGGVNQIVAVSLTAPLPGTSRLARPEDFRLATTDPTVSIFTQTSAGQLTFSAATLRFDLHFGDRIGVKLVALSSQWWVGDTFVNRSIVIG